MLRLKSFFQKKLPIRNNNMFCVKACGFSHFSLSFTNLRSNTIVDLQNLPISLFSLGNNMSKISY